MAHTFRNSNHKTYRKNQSIIVEISFEFLILIGWFLGSIYISRNRMLYAVICKNWIQSSSSISFLPPNKRGILDYN